MTHNVSSKSSLKRREHTLITYFNSQMISALGESPWESIVQCLLIIISNFSVGKGFRRFRLKKKFFLVTARSPYFFPLAWSERADRLFVDSSMVFWHKEQRALPMSFLNLLNHATKYGPSSQASTNYFWFFSAFFPSIDIFWTENKRNLQTKLISLISTCLNDTKQSTSKD